MCNKKGFTLIELLVVIAIIALLLAIIMPALNTVKEIAAYTVCLANQKGLCMAWSLYYEDNNGGLVGGSTYRSGDGRPTAYRWIERPQTTDKYGGAEATESTTPPLSLETRKNGLRAGRLFKYTENEKLYHCPADKNYVRNDPPKDSYRSYAVTGLMNGEDFTSRTGNEYSAIDQYRTVTLGSSSKTLKVAIKFNDITSPGSKLVFVEEQIPDDQNYLVGGFVLLHYGFDWWDLPAGFHNDGGTFGFADSHAEKRKWQDKDTVELINGEIYSDPDPATNADLQWMVKGYIPMR